MIFLLIAGTYTPFCFISLNGTIGNLLFSIIAAVALSGVFVFLKWSGVQLPLALDFNSHVSRDGLDDCICLPLPLAGSMEPIWLILTRTRRYLLYTRRHYFYGAKPKFLQSKYMGFHEIFHIFILLGSLSHFLCVYLFVI